MPAIPRVKQKIFGSSLVASGNVAVWGSLLAGAPAYSSDLAAIQGLAGWLNGFNGAIIGNRSPAQEDLNGFGLVVTQQLAYLLQAGIPEWHAETTYFVGGIARKVGSRLVYQSLTNDNLNNALTDTNNWAPYVAAAIGEIKLWSGAGVIPGFLGCDGSPVSRATYADLFATIGTTYGVGDGSSTFNVPDLRGRVPVGLGQGDATGATNWTLGRKAGEETHTLAANELPEVAGPEGSNADIGDPGPYVITANDQNNGGHPASFGGGVAHNNLQPSLGMGYIIKY